MCRLESSRPSSGIPHDKIMDYKDWKCVIFFFFLFGVLRHFQHCTGHITMGSWKGRGNQYIQLISILYCKLLTNGKQLPAFPLEAVPGTKPRPQRWEARVLPLCHHGPWKCAVHDNTSLHIQSASLYRLTNAR